MDYVFVILIWVVWIDYYLIVSLFVFMNCLGLMFVSYLNIYLLDIKVIFLSKLWNEELE